jgi:hypothetical protein
MKFLDFTPYEHDEQSFLIQWVDLIGVHVYPELAYLHAVPNGGYRSKRTANEMHTEGVRPGVPDLHLPVARHGFHGLYIEMKCHRKGSRLSQDQERWIKFLILQGYYVAVCWDWEEAKNQLLGYLDPSEKIITTNTTNIVVMNDANDDQAEAL